MYLNIFVYPALDADSKTKLEGELQKREDLLIPLYHSVAVMFADLHDTPGRMEEKGCVKVFIAVLTLFVVILICLVVVFTIFYGSFIILLLSRNLSVSYTYDKISPHSIDVHFNYSPLNQII